MMEAGNPFTGGSLKVLVPGYLSYDVANHGVLDLVVRGEYHRAMVALLLMKELLHYYLM